MRTTTDYSTSADLDRLIAQLRSAFGAAPTFGSITICAQFVDGKMVLVKRACEETIKPCMEGGK